MKKELLTVSSLGSNGRFGNQIFQYAFSKICAKKYNLEIQTPDWVGRYLFGCNDPLITEKFEVVKELMVQGENIFSLYTKEVVKNKDLEGYFLYRTNFYYSYKDYFCSLFKPIEDIEITLEEKLDQLKKYGSTIVGLHIRRGDYGKYPYFITPSDWYVEYLDSIWSTLKNPVLFIASDEVDKILKDFKKYNPITVKDLEISLPKAQFYPEFYLLTQCNVLAISNSTFSFAASMLNTKSVIFARPNFRYGKLIAFNPWCSDPFLWPPKLSCRYQLIDGLHNQLNRLSMSGRKKFKHLKSCYKNSE